MSARWPDENAQTQQAITTPCRSELARENPTGAALTQEARVIVDVFREQARSYMGYSAYPQRCGCRTALTQLSGCVR
ncbi:hypothetical protein METHPM2_1150008 [Pseudomonas sp. PM2]